MRTVLVVDDDEFVLRLCARVLAYLRGTHILEATNGNQAIDVATHYTRPCQSFGDISLVHHPHMFLGTACFHRLCYSHASAAVPASNCGRRGITVICLVPSEKGRRLDKPDALPCHGPVALPVGFGTLPDRAELWP